MKKLHTFKIFVLLAVVAISCKQQKKENTEPPKEQVSSTMEKPNITLEKLKGSPAYTDALLELQVPKNVKITKGGEVDFTFTVDNYQLGAQTEGPNAQQLANSGKGQHIHFILNNQPYSAHYESAFAKEIPNGVHHLVAFLSRSYHESVKNDNSVVVKKLEVGEQATDTVGLDMAAPTLIYSRPKGEYKGADTKNILLDFFVLNASLSEEGTKVRATINGKEFTITDWVPYIIKGLPIGVVTIKLELIDVAGNVIPGPFNTVTRTITLKP